MRTRGSEKQTCMLFAKFSTKANNINEIKNNKTNNIPEYGVSGRLRRLKSKQISCLEAFSLNFLRSFID